MFEQFIQRENTIFKILEQINQQGIQFILVGGYAVSAYKHRFSIDADIILKKEDLQKCEQVLLKNKFVKTINKELEHVYAPIFIRYQTINDLPVSIDLLIDGIGSRTTNASYSFDQLAQYSHMRTVVGREKEITCLVADKEVLIVLKLHSGRLTDFRDIVALCKAVDMAIVRNLIWRGKIEIVKKNIELLLSLLSKKEFIDSFKGVFIEKKYDVDIDQVKKLEELLLAKETFK